jgi:putative ABC transport system permease protein
MSKEFEFPTPTDVWIRLDLTPAERARRDALTLRVIGRLKPSITIAEAQSEMSTIAQQLERAYPVRNLNRRVRVMPVNEFVQGTIARSAIFTLFAVVGIVLLVACANIAGLQLARATDRQREIVVLAALGATRWRIVRLVLIENAVVSALGAVSGVAVASACVAALLRSMPGGVARLIPGFTHIGVDPRALVFTAVVTMITCVLAAAAPAFRSAAAAPAESLNEYRITGVAVPRQRLRHAFVAGQLAAAFALLVTSGLFASGFRNLLRTQAIHEPRQVLVMSVALPPARYNDTQARQRFYTEAIDRLAAIPGVQDAATFTTIPLSNNGTSWSLIDVERQIAANPSLRNRVVVQRVSPAFIRLLRLSLVQGRPLERTDDAAHPPVALVSRSLAGRYWPDGGVLGSRIRLATDDAGAWLTVVGIVDDVLYDWTDRVAEPAVYLPTAQAPAAAAQLAIRVNGDVTAFVQPARRELAAIDPLLPAFDVMSLSDAVGESLAGSSQIVAMMQMLTLFTLTIAIVGVYGVMAYLVAARTREFGVRMALGARPRDIARIVLRRSMGLTAVGLACGVLVAVPATRAVRGLVFGVGEDARALGLAMAVVLAAVTAIASSIPARRATKADPLAAIR